MQFFLYIQGYNEIKPPKILVKIAEKFTEIFGKTDLNSLIISELSCLKYSEFLFLFAYCVKLLVHVLGWLTFQMSLPSLSTRDIQQSVKFCPRNWMKSHSTCRRARSSVWRSENKNRKTYGLHPFLHNSSIDMFCTRFKTN